MAAFIGWYLLAVITLGIMFPSWVASAFSTRWTTPRTATSSSASSPATARTTSSASSPSSWASASTWASSSRSSVCGDCRPRCIPTCDPSASKSWRPPARWAGCCDRRHRRPARHRRLLPGVVCQRGVWRRAGRLAIRAFEPAGLAAHRHLRVESLRDRLYARPVLPMGQGAAGALPAREHGDRFGRQSRRRSPPARAWASTRSARKSATSSTWTSGSSVIIAGRYFDGRTSAGVEAAWSSAPTAMCTCTARPSPSPSRSPRSGSPSGSATSRAASPFRMAACSRRTTTMRSTRRAKRWACAADLRWCTGSKAAGRSRSAHSWQWC